MKITSLADLKAVKKEIEAQAQRQAALAAKQAREAMLLAAQRPMLIAGGSGWDAEAAAHVQTAGGRGGRFRSAQWWPLRLGDRRALLIRRDRFGKPLGRLRRLDSRAYFL